MVANKSEETSDSSDVRSTSDDGYIDGTPSPDDGAGASLLRRLAGSDAADPFSPVDSTEGGSDEQSEVGAANAGLVNAAEAPGLNAGQLGYDDFLKVVTDGREALQDRAQTHEIAQGRVWTGLAAKE
ncbi:MAG: hypothetical protein AAF449_23910, partial [Myxococcota bacterium]